jgi:hypothetical protein
MRMENSSGNLSSTKDYSGGNRNHPEKISKAEFLKSLSIEVEIAIDPKEDSRTERRMLENLLDVAKDILPGIIEDFSERELGWKRNILANYPLVLANYGGIISYRDEVHTLCYKEQEILSLKKVRAPECTRYTPSFSVGLLKILNNRGVTIGSLLENFG